VKRRAAAVSNDPVAAEAAQDFLSAGGSATGAVLSGFFASAGAYAGVLLGPLSILVGGVGVGARAFDGRLRQPGAGAKRPRGAKTDSDVAEAARVAVPTSATAALVALAYDGNPSITTILRPGIQRAERAGAEGRVSVLKLVRSVGAGAFADRMFVRALLRVAGPSQGGLLSPGDFGAVPEVDHDATVRKSGKNEYVEPAWASAVDGLDVSGLGVGYAVCAVDVRGVFAAAAFRRVGDGFSIEELELEAPLAASPVMRGVTRAAPGARLAAPAPIAFLRDASGQIIEVVAQPTALRLDTPSLVLRRSSATQEVEVALGG
jgi:gamma-glutamyltranspeptidase/glutathione hydrolase